MVTIIFESHATSLDNEAHRSSYTAENRQAIGITTKKELDRLTISLSNSGLRLSN